MATLPQVTSPPQASAEVVVNENLEALEHQACYANAYLTTTGLTWGYYGGRWGGFSVAAGTFTLTPSTTNYVVVAIATGVTTCSAVITNWNNTAAYARVYKLTTNASAVTATEDHRSGPSGVMGGSGATGAGDALVANPLSQFAATTSAQLASVISDESGTGALVFAGSPALTGTPTAPTAAAATNTTQLATTEFVRTEVANLIASSPAALDTLDELAAALGDDANFASTITSALALKAPLASPALTGTPTVPTAAPGTNTTQAASTAFVAAAVASGDVATDVIWDAAGDMVQGSGANTGVRTALGTALQQWRVNSGATAAEWATATRVGLAFEQVLALSDLTTAITTGTTKAYWRPSFAATGVSARASLRVASSSGIPTVDMNKATVSMMSTKLTIDASELTSVTAAAAVVMSTTTWSIDDLLEFDIDVAGTGAMGLVVTVTGLYA